MDQPRTVWSQIGSVAGVGVKSFAGTLALFTLWGLVLAWLSYFLLRAWPVYGVLGALLALAEGVGAGFLLGSKRAIALSLAQGVSEAGLGRTALRLVFERLLGISADWQPGERGGTVAQTVERLPLAEAEKRLRSAVTGVLQAPESGGRAWGWLKRWMQSRLLGWVEKLTLATLRKEGAEHGGVDLVHVQSELEGRIDRLLIDKLRGGLNKWTIGLILLLPAVALGQTYLIGMCLKG